jgi:hypothetical protein
MPEFNLIIHPDSSPGPVERIRVNLFLAPGGGLVLDYLLIGDPERLRIPPTGAPLRSDGLWQHTCFEAFFRSNQGPAYREFNFSPSGQWQAYDFDDYRHGSAQAAVPDPRIGCRVEPARLALHAMLGAAARPVGAVRLGLCAVIESSDGSLAYWALRHPPGKPDFHHPATFTVNLDLP